MKTNHVELADAVALLRGARARTDIIRAGEDQTIVDAQFDISEKVSASVDALLQEHGIESSQSELILQHSVPRAGRGRQFINAQLTTRGVLESVGAWLIDICSQHEHQSLTQVPHHKVPCGVPEPSARREVAFADKVRTRLPKSRA